MNQPPKPKPTRGKKICPKCKKQVGSRTQLCTGTNETTGEKCTYNYPQNKSGVTKLDLKMKLELAEVGKQKLTNKIVELMAANAQLVADNALLTKGNLFAEDLDLDGDLDDLDLDFGSIDFISPRGDSAAPSLGRRKNSLSPVSISPRLSIEKKILLPHVSLSWLQQSEQEVVQLKQKLDDVRQTLELLLQQLT